MTTERDENVKDWSRLASWSAASFVMGALLTSLPPDVVHDPAGIAVAVFGVGFMYAILALPVAALVTLFAKRRSISGLPFRDMSATASQMVLGCISCGVLARFAFPVSLASFALGCYPFWKMLTARRQSKSAITPNQARKFRPAQFQSVQERPKRTMFRTQPWMIAPPAILLVVLFAWFFRYDVRAVNNEHFTLIRHDRWTGQTEYCEPRGCIVPKQVDVSQPKQAAASPLRDLFAEIGHDPASDQGQTKSTWRDRVTPVSGGSSSNDPWAEFQPVDPGEATSDAETSVR